MISHRQFKSTTYASCYSINTLSFLPPASPALSPLFPTPPVKRLLKTGDARQEEAENAHSSFIYLLDWAEVNTDFVAPFLEWETDHHLAKV